MTKLGHCTGKNTLACKRLQDAQGCPWTCSPAHQWAIRSSLQFYGAIRPRTSLSKHLQRCLGGNDCSVLFKVRKSDKWTFLPIQGKTHTKPIISIQSILWNKLRRTFSLTSFSSLCTSFLPFLPLRFSVSAACCVPCFFFVFLFLFLLAFLCSSKYPVVLLGLPFARVIPASVFFYFFVLIILLHVPSFGLCWVAVSRVSQCRLVIVVFCFLFLFVYHLNRCIFSRERLSAGFFQ